ncbi:hypothetical protein JOQ06_001654 [Pogonophryne albipinna]|uniref:Uncharacterized protein n=1 Tax=Pogonophryne albipinna TaxID=1090488 RepID=A0AAD6B6H1_9TELE|nr:hypothetical protein JOQ06_001654 [Pogonophryne albipinna]
MELKEDQQRQSECGEALLDLLQTTESPEPTQPPSDSPQPEDTSGILNDQQDAGCQTDLTMEDIERMEDVLRQNTTELGDLRTKALDTKFNQESFENNEEKTKFYTGLPNFLVFLQLHSAPIVDETEALFSSTQAKIGLLLFAVWALKVQ